MLCSAVADHRHQRRAIERWGPPFAGRATVDLSVISFTIRLTTRTRRTRQRRSGGPISSGGLLPPASRRGRQGRARGGRPVALAGPTDPPQPAPVVQVNVTSGLVGRSDERTTDRPVYLVTAETFQCAVLTVIPSKDVVFEPDPRGGGEDRVRAGARAARRPAGQRDRPGSDFGVGPGQRGPTCSSPSLRYGAATPACGPPRYRRLANAPKALWESKAVRPARRAAGRPGQTG